MRDRIKIDFIKNCDPVLKDYLRTHNIKNKKVYSEAKKNILICEGDGLFEDLLKYHEYKYKKGYNSSFFPENMNFIQVPIFTVELKTPIYI